MVSRRIDGTSKAMELQGRELLRNAMEEKRRDGKSGGIAMIHIAMIRIATAERSVEQVRKVMEWNGSTLQHGAMGLRSRVKHRKSKISKY